MDVGVCLFYVSGGFSVVSVVFLGSELVGGLVQAYVSSDGDGEPKHYSHGWLSLTHSVIHSDLLTHLLTTNSHTYSLTY